MLMDEAVHRIPVLAETGIRKFYNGPESFTPGQPVPARAGARARQLLRRRRLQLGRHRVGGRRGPGAGRVGRLGGGDVRPDRRRRTPVRGVQRRQRLAARPGRRDPRPALRPAVAEPRAGHRARRPAVAACTRGWPRRARSSAPRWAGSARTSSHRRPAPAWTTRGASRRGCPGRRPSSAPPARRSRSSTRRRSRSTSSPGPRALEALQWVCAADVDVPVGHCVYTPWLNERGSYEADLTVTRDGPGLLLGRLVVRHHGARPRLAAPPRRRRGR